MSNYDDYEDIPVVSINFSLTPGNGRDFDEESITRIINACSDVINSEGYLTLTESEEELSNEEYNSSTIGLCKSCHGSGLDIPKPPELICPSCNGSGETSPNEEELVQEWNDLYSDKPKLKIERGTDETEVNGNGEDS